MTEKRSHAAGVWQGQPGIPLEHRGCRGVNYSQLCQATKDVPLVMVVFPHLKYSCVFKRMVCLSLRQKCHTPNSATSSAHLEALDSRVLMISPTVNNRTCLCVSLS